MLLEQSSEDVHYNVNSEAISTHQGNAFYKEMFEVMVQHSSVSMYLLENGKFTYINNRFSALSGYSAAEIINGSVTIKELLHPDDMLLVQQKIKRKADDKESEAKFQVKVYKKNGELFHAEIHSKKMMHRGKELFLGTVYDVTAEVKADLLQQEAEERFQSLFDNNPDSIFVFDLVGNFVGANPSCETLTGYSKEELLGMPFAPVVAPEDLDISIDYFQKAAQGESNFHEIVIIQKDGSRKHIEISKFPMHQAGLVIGVYGIAKDITEKVEYREMMEKLINYDPLTNLANRKLFEEQVSILISNREETTFHPAVLFLDLDRFKFINDSLGHHLGDEFLKLVAERLKEHAGQGELVGRFAGDEFAILLPECTEAAAITLAKQLNKALMDPFEVMGHSISVSVSIGVAFHKEGLSGEDLIQQADTAMYYTKKFGKNNFKIYTEELDNTTVYKLTIEKDLKTAIQNDEFSLYYQPIMNLKTGEIDAMEALIRWKHPHLGMVPPDNFIPVSEESGEIISIGAWVLETACMQNKAWQKEGITPFKVCVNISTIQLQHPQFLDSVRQVLHESGLSPQWLELEITESVLLEDTELLQESFRRLKAMGISLSIDDFGTGYTSLSYLRQFSFDRVKIDRSFIHDMNNGESDRAITSAIISLARRLHMGVVAEGIEDETQLTYLMKEMCESGQGYYFSRPLPAEEHQLS